MPKGGNKSLAASSLVLTTSRQGMGIKWCRSSDLLGCRPRTRELKGSTTGDIDKGEVVKQGRKDSVKHGGSVRKKAVLFRNTGILGLLQGGVSRGGRGFQV